ncbi:DUF6263 family protein [Rivularia sp. UHCC 0363]|uniref:DUF6263 family protein n=1 Tax=Rivularia sp. UHCC 0363 TaxID=3110244 RepID=UPI002B20D3E0|nr:DUF6263 family protein [Rivularia sp. UHCC 0363]MEA5594256.1 DUF6263 family protein [Rivularia sp. UHCC 0363]
MKRLFLASSIFLVVSGWGLEQINSVNAQTSSIVISTQKQATKPTTNKLPQLKVISTGTGNKEKLRFTSKVGAKQTVNVTLNKETLMSIGEHNMPRAKLPAYIVRLDSTVTKVEPSGDIHYDIAYSDVKIQGDAQTRPELIEVISKQIEQLENFKGSVVIDNQGIAKSVKYAIPQKVDVNMKFLVEQLSNSLQQLSSPVPEAAVGIGAKWQVNSETDINGISLKQTTTYELVNLKGNVATLNVNLQQQEKSIQEIDYPGLPLDGILTLQSFKGNAKGKATIQLDKVMPVSSQLSLLADSQYIGKNVNTLQETPLISKLIMDMNVQGQ